jgi:SUMO ligase MMS21 Smc5/6 complex component
LEKDACVQVVQKVLDEVQLENVDLSRKVQSLTVKLESQADYASIKKDLTILKVTKPIR